MLIDSNIRMLLEMGIMPEMDDIFFEALDYKGFFDEAKIQDRYEKQSFLMNLCLTLIVDHKQTELNWQYVKDNGLLCKKAEEWFKEELKDVI